MWRSTQCPPSVLACGKRWTFGSELARDRVFSVDKLSTDVMLSRAGSPLQVTYFKPKTMHRSTGGHTLDHHELLAFTEHEVAEMRRFNKKLGWLPRFRSRTRLMPRGIQTLLRAGQIGGASKLAKHGQQAEKRSVGV
ncbi:MAG: hypothetical protein ABWZ39_15400, partial [Pseudomonas caspiana]